MFYVLLTTAMSDVLIVRVGGISWRKKGHDKLKYTVGIYRQKIVRSKGCSSSIVDRDKRSGYILLSTVSRGINQHT